MVLRQEMSQETVKRMWDKGRTPPQRNMSMVFEKWQVVSKHLRTEVEAMCLASSMDEWRLWKMVQKWRITVAHMKGMQSQIDCLALGCRQTVEVLSHEQNFSRDEKAAALWDQLHSMNQMALQRYAISCPGVSERAVERAVTQGDPKEALISLIIPYYSSRQQCGHSGGKQYIKAVAKGLLTQVRHEEACGDKYNLLAKTNARQMTSVHSNQSTAPPGMKAVAKGLSTQVRPKEGLEDKYNLLDKAKAKQMVAVSRLKRIHV